MNKKKCLLIFLKIPVKGCVKTRLAATMGDGFALEAYRLMIRDLLENLKELTVPVRFYLDREPGPGDLERFTGTGRDFSWEETFTQKEADLGERIYCALEESFDDALLIGSDIPQITSNLIGACCAGLENADIALGPTGDGGYYLIGFNGNSLRKELFADIPWSTGNVYRKTVEKAEALGLKRYTAVELQDIDTYTDLEQVVRDNRPVLKNLTCLMNI